MMDSEHMEKTYDEEFMILCIFYPGPVLLKKEESLYSEKGIPSHLMYLK